MYEGHSQSPEVQSDILRQTPFLPESNNPRIGLFDSGVGGLSVLRALQNEIPWAEYVYLGDTARLPYGQRSPKTIIEYSMQASRFLHDAGVDTIIIACNTASSVALKDVQQNFSDTFVQGVVEAGAQAAVAASPTGRIAVIGTACTVNSGAYTKAITRLAPHAEVRSRSCSFLVSLAEEGWTDGEIALMSVQQYLAPLIKEFGSQKPDCIILGCTHFSRFSDVIRRLLGPEISLINPAHSLAKRLASTISPMPHKRNEVGSVSFFATDALQRFSRVGGLFLGKTIPTESLERVTLDNL